MKNILSYKLPLLALLIITGQANLAQAQDSEALLDADSIAKSQPQGRHYFVADFGTIISDGGNGDVYESYYADTHGTSTIANANTYTLSGNSDVKHQGNITRLAYGYRLDEKTYLEIGRSNLGEIEYKYNHLYYPGSKEEYDFEQRRFPAYTWLTGTPCNYSNGQFDNLTKCNNVSSFHRYAISAFDVSAIYRYQLNDKVDLLARAGIALYEWERLEGTVAPAIKTRAAETLLFGFGAEFGKIRAEYRLYDIPHILLNDNTEYKLYNKVGILSIGYKFEF